MDEASLLARYSVPLRGFLEEAFSTLERLRQDVPGVSCAAKKRPEEILSMLLQMLRFEQISLLEVHYIIPGTRKRPGIRFWLEGPQNVKRLRAVLFEDTVIWNVSYRLERLYTELGTFRLEEGGIVAQPAQALAGRLAPDPDWKACLRAVLRAPLP